MARAHQDVRIFAIQDRRSSERNKRGWVVRCSVDGRQHSRSFHTKAEADRYRSSLLLAKTSGETFDDCKGEPLTWQPAPDDVRVHVWAARWLAEEWPEWAPRTRSSALEVIARFVPLLVSPAAPQPPDELRVHLLARLDPDSAWRVDSDCERWLDRWSLQLSQLNRQVLAGAERQLLTAANGEPLAATTAARYRTNARACIRRAVDLEILAADPWPPRAKGRSRRKASRPRQLDVRKLPDPETMAMAIKAIASHQPGSRTYQMMTALAYYAGLRPSEVVMLRRRVLHLPDTGWGRLDVVESDISFDEPGEPKTGPRSVPIPPVLVTMLTAWVVEHDFGPSDLLFRTRTGGPPQPSNWSRAWHRALRQVGLDPLRVYDCRHAAATTWLQAGAPLGEVARRLGHSVETLVSTYVGALAGDEVLANERIEEILG